MERIFSPGEGRELLKGWQIHARKNWRKHDEAARLLESHYWIVGGASFILSAIVGASIFASIEAMYEPWTRIIAGIVSISASVMSSLITFFRFQERTEKHRAAGVAYKTALRALEGALAASSNSIPDQDSINKIKEELDRIEMSAPVVPEKVNRAVEQRFENYEFVANAAELVVPATRQ